MLDFLRTKRGATMGLWNSVRLATLIGAVGVLTETSAVAQTPRGGEIRLQAIFSAEEQITQSDLWVFDVYFKPMRMLAYERTDPKTGEKKVEYVWYIVYRGFNHKLESKGKENPPVNELDPPIAPLQFVPEAILVTTDNDRNEVYEDHVIPEALAAINKREKGNYKNSVSVVGPVPEATLPGSPDDVPIEGVFMWRGVNPDANRYTVFLTGFSNGLRKVEGPDGTQIIQTKTIMQKYWRRGDRFDQRESEIVLDGDSQWIYR